MKDFLTITEIAKLEKVTRPTVWRWIKSGEFSGVRKVANQFRVPLREYQKWRDKTVVKK
jgi:excisionase family DNA binding protein